MEHWADVFVRELRERAELMARHGDERGAQMCTLHASEIEARRQTYEDEELTPAAAVEESGYTASNLRRLRKDGLWTGRRRDLPKRPGATPILRDTSAPEPSLAERVLARSDGGEPRRRRKHA